VIDEVLRGTNTVERIAASSELLKHLDTEKTLCLAATHDVELCALLDGQYRSLHFEESVTEDGEVLFDYKLKDGPATTRNAIKLLGSMGFDKSLVERANEKAERYTAEGKWR
jgi:DNA mismatch repair ATPase MutS